MTAGHKLAANYWDPFIDMCSDKYNTTANESIWEAEFAGNNTSDTQAEGRIGNIIGLAGPDLSSKSDVTGSQRPRIWLCLYLQHSETVQPLCEQR